MKNLIDCIIKIKSEWDDYLKESLAEYSITYGEYNGIVVLDNEEKLSSNILADRMNLSPSRASRVIENMVRKNVLTREIDCTDRRKCTIELTEMGIEIKNKIERIKLGFYKKIVGHLEKREIDIVRESLEKIVNNCRGKK